MITLNCYIFGDGPGQVFSIDIEATDNVIQLKKAIKDMCSPMFNHIVHYMFELFAVSIICDGTLEKRVTPMDLGPPLSPWIQLHDLFPNPSPSHVHVVVKPPQSTTSKRKRKVESEDFVPSKHLKFEEAQKQDVEVGQKALTPSSAATIPRFKAEQQKRPVLNGRPSHNYGPPVGLFHPVFNSFQADIRSTEPFYPDAATYSAVRSLFAACAEIHDNKIERVEAIDTVLPGLLGRSFTVIEVPGVKCDGVIIEACGLANAYQVIREVKNEIGTDPYNQGSLAYRKYWAADSQETIRAQSYCPSIILAIAGPWLCVLGGVYLEKVVIQPLTDYLWLGGDSFDNKRLLFAARLFAALKSAISALKTYYTSDLSKHILQKGFPFIRGYQSNTFTYISRLATDYPDKLLYKAKLDGSGRLVVVKFVSRYYAAAHRFLAEHGLAPSLHYASIEHAEAPMYGGRYMIVIDFVEGQQAEGALSPPLFKQVAQAIKLLHSRDLVFGDLRTPNILVKDDESIMIIDFDWCGEAEQAHYPVSLNNGPEIGWPEGVGPGCVMKKAHDLFMLNRLQSA